MTEKRWELRMESLVWEDFYYGILRASGHLSKDKVVNYLIDDARAAILNAADPVWRKQADGDGYDFNTRIIFKAGDKTIKFKTEQEIIDALDDFIEREGMTDTSEIYIVKKMPKRECVVWQRSKGLL